MATLWKALATNIQLARKVMTLLYIKLKLRPPQLVIRLTEQAELMSMLVSSRALPCPHLLLHLPLRPRALGAARARARATGLTTG